jgi:hypothetical protein
VCEAASRRLHKRARLSTGGAVSGAHGAETLLFFVEVFQLFLQAALGEHVFQLAPRSLAFLGGAAFVRARAAIDESIELLFLFVAFSDEVVVEIEVVVVSLHHVVPKKAWRIN